MRDQEEDVLNGSFGGDGSRQQLQRHRINEFLLRTYPLRRSRRPPAFVIDSAQDRRQLRSKSDRLLGCKSVAKLMENGAQRTQRRSLVVEIGIVAELLQPPLRLLHCMRYCGGHSHSTHSGL